MRKPPHPFSGPLLRPGGGAGGAGLGGGESEHLRAAEGGRVCRVGMDICEERVSQVSTTEFTETFCEPGIVCSQPWEIQRRKFGSGWKKPPLSSGKTRSGQKKSSLSPGG